MTVMHPQQPHAGDRLTLWSWIAVALVPVGVAVVALIATVSFWARVERLRS